MSADIDVVLDDNEQRVVRAMDDEYDLHDEPPICKVWEWQIVRTPAGRGWSVHVPPFLMARLFCNHPVLGTRMYHVEGRELMTTTILWMNMDLKLVRTRNTLYKLMGPGQN